MELLRTDRLLLRHWDESDLAAFFDLYSREDVVRWLGAHPRRPLATDEGVTQRWFGLTARQYSKVISGSPGSTPTVL
jgi:RimJ/RimL family protein N-acetyltransferase